MKQITLADLLNCTATKLVDPNSNLYESTIEVMLNYGEGIEFSWDAVYQAYRSKLIKLATIQKIQYDGRRWQHIAKIWLDDVFIGFVSCNGREGRDKVSMIYASRDTRKKLIDFVLSFEGQDEEYDFNTYIDDVADPSAFKLDKSNWTHFTEVSDKPQQ